MERFFFFIAETTRDNICRQLTLEPTCSSVEFHVEHTSKCQCRRLPLAVEFVCQRAYSRSKTELWGSDHSQELAVSVLFQSFQKAF